MLFLVNLMPFFMPIAVVADNDRDDFAEAVALLCGAGSEEEIDEDILESYSRLARHPLHLNTASHRTVAASGLLTPYQAASFYDYRSRNGDVLSFSELGAINGFGEPFARALSHFVVLDSDKAPGAAEAQPKADSEVIVRSTMKAETGGGGDYAYGTKLRVTYGDDFSLGVTSKRPYGADGLFPQSVNASVLLTKRNLKLVLGDFNARFGQGLVWRSGFGLAGFGSVAAFSVNPTGLSPAWSYSSPGRGGGLCVSMGRMELTTAMKLAGMDVMPLINASLFLPVGQLGLTMTKEAVSLDTRFCTGRVDWFGEAAYGIQNRSPALISGLVFNPEYGKKLGLRFRCYPSAYKVSTASAGGATARSSDEIGATIGYEAADFIMTLDAMERPSDRSRQYRAVLSYIFSSEGPWTLSLRAVERFKPESELPFKTDLRAQLGYTSGRWQHALRVNALTCRYAGYLGYYEAGWTDSRQKFELKTFGRMALFDIDHWDDRIYVYERDAPGNFSSRAFCGRGWNAQVYAGITWRTHNRKRFSLYAKVMIQDITREEPHDRRMVELRLQAVARF